MAVDPAIQFSAGLPLRAAQLNKQVRDYNVQGMLGLARTRGQMAYVTAEREIGMIDPPTDTTVLQHAGTSNTPPSWAKVQGVHIQNSTITKNKLASDVSFAPQSQSIRMDHLAYGDAETWRGLAGAQLFHTHTSTGTGTSVSSANIPPYGFIFVYAAAPDFDPDAVHSAMIPAPIMANGGRFGNPRVYNEGSGVVWWGVVYGKGSSFGKTGNESERLVCQRLGQLVGSSNTIVKFYWYECAVGLGVPV